MFTLQNQLDSCTEQNNFAEGFQGSVDENQLQSQKLQHIIKRGAGVGSGYYFETIYNLL